MCPGHSYVGMLSGAAGCSLCFSTAEGDCEFQVEVSGGFVFGQLLVADHRGYEHHDCNGRSDGGCDAVDAGCRDVVIEESCWT